jgi:hypothetical protein
LGSLEKAAKMYKSFPPSVQMLYSTSRIETTDTQGQVSTGTGFLLQLNIKDDIQVDVLVTNKHVIKGASKGRINFTVENPPGQPDIYNHSALFIDNFTYPWINHPDPNIDICVLPITSFIEQAKKQGMKDPFYIAIPQSLIPSEKYYEELNAVEEILMVGYPNGLWDEVHNLPLFRKGITATHPGYYFNNRPEFLIDTACFPGSSGSPVFLYNQGAYINKSGEVKAGYRAMLIGILYAGPQYTAEGDIVVIDVPTSKVPKVISSIPINLGYTIRANKLLDFIEIIKNIME